jgi:hypothetical protein
LADTMIEADAPLHGTELDTGEEWGPRQETMMDRDIMYD